VPYFITKVVKEKKKKWESLFDTWLMPGTPAL
jgi:hypothetical protein